MSWTSALPQDTWDEHKKMDFLREIWHRLKFGTFTWDPPSVTASSHADTTLTSATVPALAGLSAGMLVHVTPPSTIAAGIVVSSWVTANNSLTIRLRNLTAGAINLPSGTWGFQAVLP